MLFIDENRNYKNEIGGAENEINFNEISENEQVVLYTRCCDELKDTDRIIGNVFGSGTTWDVMTYIAYCAENKIQLNGIKYSNYFKNIIIEKNKKNKTDLSQELANDLSSAFVMAVPSDKLEYFDIKLLEDKVVLDDSAFFNSEIFVCIERIKKEINDIEFKLKAINPSYQNDSIILTEEEKTLQKRIEALKNKYEEIMKTFGKTTIESLRFVGEEITNREEAKKALKNLEIKNKYFLSVMIDCYDVVLKNTKDRFAAIFADKAKIASENAKQIVGTYKTKTVGEKVKQIIGTHKAKVDTNCNHICNHQINLII